jgi:hypothetical protein
MKRKPDGEVERITKGRALGPEFCLGEKDLAMMEYEEAPNPHFRRAGAPMRLYALEDVLARSHAKHGGPAGVEAAAAKRAATAAKRAATKQEKCDNRRAQLMAALGEFRLELRSDSALCDSFIRTGHMEIDQVVRRMCEMRFLHEYTPYRNVLYSIRDDWRYMGERWDADETAEEAEAQALREVHGWPARWPWLSGTWSRQTHKTFSKRLFRDPVRELLLCLQHTPLGAVDPATRSGVAEHIVMTFAKIF